MDEILRRAERITDHGPQMGMESTFTGFLGAGGLDGPAGQGGCGPEATGARRALGICMTKWPCSCGEGWRPIVEDLLAEFDRIAQEEGELIRHSFQEKYGELRVYTNCRSPSIDAAIEVAVARSRVTCEGCGRPSELRTIDGVWMTTRCHDCRRLRR